MQAHSELEENHKVIFEVLKNNNINSELYLNTLVFIHGPLLLMSNGCQVLNVYDS